MLRAVREDEDAARALGKNALCYKLQSLAIAAALGGVAGWFLVLAQGSVSQEAFEPIFTFIGYAVLVLGGLASFPGVLFGSFIFWAVYEGSAGARVAARVRQGRRAALRARRARADPA